MKKIYLFLLIYFISNFVIAQSKLGNVWVFGVGGVGGIINFDSSPPDTSSLDSMEIGLLATEAIICDQLGNLLFYSNGLKVAGSDHKIMEGSEIDVGDFPGTSFNGRSTPQFMLALPLPSTEGQYYLFHKFAVGLDYEVIDLHYSIVDMGQNNGLGEITLKNQPLIEGVRLDRGEVTACRHANGRDWWLLQAEVNDNRYHRLLLSPDGITYKGHQEIGEGLKDGLGQAAFSPDGTKYARFNLINYMVGAYIDVYDFDRCDGTLSNHVQMFYLDGSTAGGLAISPNSRFLYIPSRNNVFQYDLQATYLEASKVIVAEYDGYTSPLETSFFMAQLAPDGKIYISATNGVDVLHVINSPDEKGLACDLQQHSFELPAINGFSLPNHPYFDLGALAGSPCDTLGLTPAMEVIEAAPLLSFYPNPASEEVKIKNAFNGKYDLVIFDINGKEVLKHSSINGGSDNIIDLKGLPNGAYLCKAKKGNKILATERLIIVR